MSSTPGDDIFKAERERHGPVTDEDRERAQKMLQDSDFATWAWELRRP